MIKIYFDGAIKFNPDRKTGKIGFGYVIKENEMVICSGGGFVQEGTTPQAEYLGLIKALKEANEKGIKEFVVYGDSQLICYQVSGRYNCYNPVLKPFLLEAKKDMQKNKIFWIPREKNQEADFIAGKYLQEGLQNEPIMA